jgi:hypothetical protein
MAANKLMSGSGVLKIISAVTTLVVGAYIIFILSKWEICIENDMAGHIGFILACSAYMS